MQEQAEWPPAEYLPHDFAERERAFACVTQARLEIDVLIAEHKIYHHEYTVTQATLLAQVEHVEARLDAISELAGTGVVIHPETITLLHDALDQLDVIRQDTDGDFEYEDFRFAEKINQLASAIAAWTNALH